MWKMFNFNKKKKMEAELIGKKLKDIVEKYKGSCYEWVKGDYMGMTEFYKDVISDGTNIFLMFESGNRVNIENVDEFLLEIATGIKDVDKQVVHVNEYNLGYEQVDRVEAVTKNIPQITNIVYEEAKQVSDSPIYKLLRKQKNNPVTVSLSLKLNLPGKDLYNILVSSFDDAEKDIINFALDDINIDDIKKSLTESLNLYYTIPKKEKISDKTNKNKEE